MSTQTFILGYLGILVFFLFLGYFAGKNDLIIKIASFGTVAWFYSIYAFILVSMIVVPIIHKGDMSIDLGVLILKDGFVRFMLMAFDAVILYFIIKRIANKISSRQKTTVKMKKLFTFLMAIIMLSACKKNENKGPFGSSKVGEPVNGGYILSKDSKGHGVMMADTGVFAALTYEQALDLCSAYRSGGYSDWRMPNGTELSTMGNQLYRKSIGDFPSSAGYTHYWGSQFTPDSVYVGYFNIDSVMVRKTKDKKTPAALRPVRNY